MVRAVRAAAASSHLRKKDTSKKKVDSSNAWGLTDFGEGKSDRARLRYSVGDVNGYVFSNSELERIFLTSNFILMLYDFSKIIF